MQVSKNDVDQIVRNNFEKSSMLTDPGLQKAVSDSLYEILEKYDRDIKSFVNAKVS